MKKRMKLTIMEVIKYKFGNMDCNINDDGKIIPVTNVVTLANFFFKDEEDLIKTWNMSAKKLNKFNKRLIKVYKNGIEYDITPEYKEIEND